MKVIPERLPLNTGDCLIEATSWTGLTVFVCPVFWLLAYLMKIIPETGRVHCIRPLHFCWYNCLW